MQIIQSKLLNSYSNLLSGFSTKKNGNLAFHVNDKESSVIKKHEVLADMLKYDVHSLVHMKQIHSKIVKKIETTDNFISPPTCDALITDKKNIALMVMVADCSPILFFDPQKEIIAVAHAGRAGAFNNITKNVLESFQNEYHSNIQDIKVSIGANIKECCYEVGEEIMLEAQTLGLEFSISQRANSYYLNVSSIIDKQLKELGVKDENIEFIDECTCCTLAHYSYRRESQTGREAGILMLRD